MTVTVVTGTVVTVAIVTVIVVKVVTAMIVLPQYYSIYLVIILVGRSQQSVQATQVGVEYPRIHLVPSYFSTVKCSAARCR